MKQKIVILIFSLFFMLFSSQYKQENGDTVIEVLNLKEEKEADILLTSPSLSFENKARFFQGNYVLLYSDISRKINCKIYMDLKGNYIFINSESCSNFSGKYNLIKN